MSLITDAMNEAQREANKRRKDSEPALLGDPFPQTKRVVAEREWPSNRTLVYASIGFLVFASAVSTAIITYRRLKASTPPVATCTPTPTKRVEAVAAPQQTRTLPPTAPSTTIATAPQRRIPSRGPAPSTPKVSPPQRATPVVRELAAAPLPSQPRATDDAIRIVVDPTVLRPGDSLFARAYAEHTRGNLDGAAELYERALASPPVSPELYNDYGALLATRGKHAAAIAMYNLGIAANGKDARLWANLGDSYRALGRRADAMSAYFEAAKLDPANIAVKVRLASEYALLGDTANARRGFEQAVRATPNDPEAHYRFGAFLRTQHDLRGAIRELQTFVDLAAGKYPPDVIDRTKAFIANLRRQ